MATQAFIGIDAFDANNVNSQLRFDINGPITIIQINNDEVTTDAEFEIELSGTFTLAADNFLLN